MSRNGLQSSRSSLALPACATDIHPTASPPVAPIRVAELWNEPVTALIFMT